MKYRETNGLFIKLHIVIFILTTILVNSCTKEVVIVPDDINPPEVILLLPESNNSNNLTLTAEIRYLNNNDIIKSHGFLIHPHDGNANLIKEYPISSILKPGLLTYKIPDPEAYFEGIDYVYQYFIKTDTKLYLSENKQFSLNNLKVSAKEKLMVVGGDTIIIEGNFINIENNYDLICSFSLYQGFDYKHIELKVQFEIINSGQNIRFTVPKNLPQGTNLIFRLVNKVKPNLNTVIATADNLIRLSPPLSYTKYYNDLIGIPNDLNSYNNVPKIRVFIGNVFLEYNSHLLVSDFIREQNGKSFAIGYTNGRDTITFPKSLQLIEPNPNDFLPSLDYVHPGTTFEILGPDSEQFNFKDYVTVGGKEAYYLQDISPSKLINLTILDLPNGEYPLKMNNRHFNYISHNKIKVKKVNITSSSKNVSYVGEMITLKGVFVKDFRYGLHFNKDVEITVICKSEGEIEFEVPKIKPGKHAIKLGYSNQIGNYKSYYSNEFPLEIKPTTINSVYPLRAEIGGLITIEGQGLNGFKPRIGEWELPHIISQNDKIQFKVPNNLAKGKYRLSISATNNLMNDVIYVSEYIEIY